MLYYWKKQKIGFEFSSSFRYHMLNILHSEDQEIDNSYSLISDFHFTINKFFPLRKNMLRAAIGYSFLNRGTEFDYKYEYINAPGDTVYYSGLYDLHFSTFNAGIGYQINQLSFELVNRFSFHKFSTDGYIYIPELRVTYGFRLKNEKIFQ